MNETRAFAIEQAIKSMEYDQTYIDDDDDLTKLIIERAKAIEDFINEK